MGNSKSVHNLGFRLSEIGSKVDYCNVRKYSISFNKAQAAKGDVGHRLSLILLFYLSFLFYSSSPLSFSGFPVPDIHFGIRNLEIGFLKLSPKRTRERVYF